MPSRLIPVLARRGLAATFVLPVLFMIAAPPAFAAAVTSPPTAPAMSAPAASADVAGLDKLLALENEYVAAYQIAIDGGLLGQPALNVALLFQSQHKAHVDSLIAAVKERGGAPVVAQAAKVYAQGLNASTLKTPDAVLQMLAKLEHQGADATIAAIPGFKDPALAKLAGRLLADQSMYWTALEAVMQKPLPTQALTFGQ
ncbi:MAG TPA: DUF4439 domain-containing protein [Alphaproteobacteria bacterium]|nr:DUF4439 domain-containing protein [Alphaproteobacteria bacterium]